MARKASLNNSRTFLPYTNNPDVKRVGLRPVYKSTSYNKIRAILPTIEEGSIIERSYLAVKKQEQEAESQSLLAQKLARKKRKALKDMQSLSSIDVGTQNSLDQLSSQIEDLKISQQLSKKKLIQFSDENILKGFKKQDFSILDEKRADFLVQ